MHTQVDFSRELILARHGNGIKLLRPERDHQHLSLGHLMDQETCLFFKNTQHELIECNQADAEALCLASKQDIIGSTIAKICQYTEQVEKVHAHNNLVMQSRNILSADEMVKTKEGIELNAISVKMPFYNHDNQIIGVFGIATILQNNVVTSNFSHFAKTLNLFFSRDPFSTKNQPSKISEGQHFTAREHAIIKDILSGKTMREIGLMYDRSTRTIEVHVANIKLKVGVKTRSQLIEKLREMLNATN